jgi:predicted nucleic acid-binding protein
VLVVDANIAIKFVALEPGRDEALARLGIETELVAPRWLLVEAGNALWRKAKLGEMDRQDAERCLVALPGFFESLVDDAALILQAHSLSFELDHWIYDCLYLALALDRESVLLTADKKFANAATRAGYGDAVELLSWKDTQ